jgi:hypothetical protein
VSPLVVVHVDVSGASGVERPLNSTSQIYTRRHDNELRIVEPLREMLCQRGRARIAVGSRLEALHAVTVDLDGFENALGYP